MAPSRNPETLQALREAAAGWRRREALANPLAVQRQRLLAWMEIRPDLEEPIAFGTEARRQQLEAGQRLLMPGDPDPWHVRLRLHTPLQAVWLPAQPLEGVHISRQNPVELVWSDDRAERQLMAGALAILRDAAAGSAPALAWILRHTGWPAAAALVEERADDDGIYEHGSGLVPRECPSPRRLLLSAFADQPKELAWLEHLADGGDDWDSGPAALPVPRGEALRPGQAPAAADWMAKV